MDSNHPYYLHPSDSLGMNLISTVFDGRGFPGWRRSILIALSTKRKLGFINGTCQAPPSDASDSSQWNCCNDMVTSWLLNSLSKEIGDRVIYSNTAKELWDSLEQRFGKSNSTKLFHLQKELNGLVQGNSDISGYFTKLKRLWDELDSLNADITCSCVCVCNGKSKISKSLQDQRLIQFLMGLNDTYGQARGTILMMNPLPGMDLAYSLLLQDENQREIYQHTQTAPDSYFVMTVNHGNHNRSFGSPNLRNGNGNQNFRNGYGGQKSGVYTQKPGFPSQRFGINTQRTKGKKSKYNPNATCTYCFRIGHVMDDCHRLHGYPEDFEFTKGKNSIIKGTAAFAGEDNSYQSTKEGGTTNFQHFTKKEMAKITQMVKEIQMSQLLPSTEINVNGVAGPSNEESGSFW